jgi:signal transduction histidine kinase
MSDIQAPGVIAVTPQESMLRADEQALRALNALMSIAKVDLKLSGRFYLREMVKRIAQTLGVAFVFVGRTSLSDTNKVDTLEMWANGDFVPNFTYDLDNTPCMSVLDGERVCIYADNVAEMFPLDLMLTEMGVRSYAGAPLIMPRGGLSGLLVALDTKPCLEPAIVQVVLDFFAGRAATELERQQTEDLLRAAQSELERRVEERTEALIQAQHKLVEMAHRSGMADIATNVLHNVGNILTAAEISSSELERLINSRASDIWRKATALLVSYADDLPTFLSTDPRGQQLSALFQEAVRVMDAEADRLVAESASLHRSLALITAVIADQQSYARGGETLVNLNVAEVAAEVISVFAHRFSRHHITVTADLPPLPVRAAKVKLFQIISNLIRNAIDFVAQAQVRTIRLTSPSPNTLLITDSGPGVKDADVPHLFTLGFSTRPNGNGVGLHSAAVLATEIGATITFCGNHPGASFSISFAPKST